MPRPLEIEVRGVDLFRSSAAVLTGEEMNSHNTAAALNTVTVKPFNEVQQSDHSLSLTMPPMSILKLDIQTRSNHQ